MEDKIPIRPDRSLLLGRQTSNWSLWDVVFHENNYFISVLENAGRFPVSLIRTGNTSEILEVQVDTMDGSAVAGEDYIAVHEVFP